MASVILHRLQGESAIWDVTNGVSNATLSFQKLLQITFSVHESAVPGEYDGGECLLEVFEEALKYAVDRGMHTGDITTFLGIFTKVLMSLVEKESGCSVEKSAGVLKECLLSSTVPISRTVSYHATTYITKTLLQHFKLYHYLLNNQQQESHTKLAREVETCEKGLPPLSEGLEESEWKKKEKVREIEKQHTLRERVLEEERRESIEREKNEMDRIEQEVVEALKAKASAGFTEAEIKEIATSIADARIKHFLGCLSYEMTHQEGSMGVKVESLVVQAEPGPGSTSPPPGKKSPTKSPQTTKSPAGSGRTSGRKS